MTASIDQSTPLEHKKGTAGASRMRRGAAVLGFVLFASIAAGCGGAPSAAPGSSSGLTTGAAASSTPATPTTTTTTALSECGSHRDPFDPTNSSPPSPARC
jgi:hypothetical protein